MNFGEALAHLCKGGHVARLGWNGKGMFLFVSSGTNITVTSTRVEIEGREGDVARMPVDPVICMRTAGRTVQPGWHPSTADMFATDWCGVRVDGSTWDPTYDGGVGT